MTTADKTISAWTVGRVSCITTTYRKFQYLYRTLDSIFAQDYPDIELVIGDDGSDNFPEEQIRAYIAAHKRENITNVQIIHYEENHGTVYNTSFCREQATGEYLFGIASDDCFTDSEVVSDIVRFMREHDAPIVACRRQFVSEKIGTGMACMPFKNQARWMKKLPPEKVFEKMASFGFISGSCTYYRKDFYMSMGGYDRAYKYIEDYPFYLRVLRGGHTIWFYDRVSVFYRYGAGISTASHANNAFRDAMYDDRIRYVEQEILPYMDRFPWWRKEQMKARLKRFQIEKSTRDNSLLRVYARLFLYSPVGCLVQAWYQFSNKQKLRFRNS